MCYLGLSFSYVHVDSLAQQWQMMGVEPPKNQSLEEALTEVSVYVCTILAAPTMHMYVHTPYPFMDVWYLIHVHVCASHTYVYVSVYVHMCFCMCVCDCVCAHAY